MKSFLICLFLLLDFSSAYGNAFNYPESRKLFFQGKNISYRGRTHVNFATNMSEYEKTFCINFDTSQFTPDKNKLFSPKQCGDGAYPNNGPADQLSGEDVISRIAVMCDKGQVRECLKYALNSQWARKRWVEDEIIRNEIDGIFSEAMEMRVKDLMAAGSNLRETNKNIFCRLLRYDLCSDQNQPASKSQYSDIGEEFFTEKASECDAHLISNCIFNAVYSSWASKKWSDLSERKKNLLNIIRKSREERIKIILNNEAKKRAAKAKKNPLYKLWYKMTGKSTKESSDISSSAMQGDMFSPGSAMMTGVNPVMNNGMLSSPVMDPNMPLDPSMGMNDGMSAMPNQNLMLAGAVAASLAPDPLTGALVSAVITDPALMNAAGGAVVAAGGAVVGAGKALSKGLGKAGKGLGKAGKGIKNLGKKFKKLF